MLDEGVWAEIKAGGEHLRLFSEHNAMGVQASVYDVNAKRWSALLSRSRTSNKGKRKLSNMTICKGRPGRVKAMALFRVTFHQLRHDSRDYGSDDRHIVSRVFLVG